MKIWRTSTPLPHDYPIWAYIGDNPEEVVLLRYPEEYLIQGTVWTRADIPPPPTEIDSKDQVDIKFQELADDSISDYWCSSDWFRAGYNHALGNVIGEKGIIKSNTGWKS